MENIRPWRRLRLQLVTADKFQRSLSERDEPDSGQLAQVGGHGAWDKSQAMQVSREGLVLKPVQEGARGERELEFFRTLAATTDPAVARFREVTPGFHGVEERAGQRFLCMENLTLGCKKPCIMDIKVGARTWGPDASPEKQESQDRSYAATKEPFGFSVPGLSVHTGPDRQQVVTKGKEFGKQLNAENIDSMLELYLDREHHPATAAALARIFKAKLDQVLKLFQSQTTFHFFASSLLFVYDGAAAVQHQQDGDGGRLGRAVSLTMIDFAHVWSAEGRLDENYSRGVRSLISLCGRFTAV